VPQGPPEGTSSLSQSQTRRGGVQVGTPPRRGSPWIGYDDHSTARIRSSDNPEQLDFGGPFPAADTGTCRLVRSWG